MACLLGSRKNVAEVPQGEDLLIAVIVLQLLENSLVNFLNGLRVTLSVK